MAQLSAEAVISLVIGLVFGVPQLLFTILNWWEVKQARAKSNSSTTLVCFLHEADPILAVRLEDYFLTR